jgi:hypothetical protein
MTDEQAKVLGIAAAARKSIAAKAEQTASAILRGAFLLGQWKMRRLTVSEMHEVKRISRLLHTRKRLGQLAYTDPKAKH